MQIVRAIIQNFRGIKNATLYFTNHTVLVGDNNVGKSTIFEALNLVLGPDRLSGSNPIDEHDFYASRYLEKDKTLITIYVEVVISYLTEEQKRHFRGNLEFWDTQEKRIISEPPIEEIEKKHILEALRVCFKGQYNLAEDDFDADTYFCFPEPMESRQSSKFWKNDKRTCGFLYLRALRTGTRALSMERGSLLDIILQLKEMRPQMWEDVIKEVSKVPVATDPALGISGILTSIQNAIKEYVPQDWGVGPHLKISDLTRENLRKVLTVFMATGATVDGEAHFAPYYHLGTGTINMLVLSLLSMIADEKQNVIFAMEEPETAIPPYAQKRIVKTVQKKSAQTFFTTHSPYVLEEFAPEDILVLQRNTSGELSGVPFSYPSAVKPKFYSLEFRKRYAEALLAKRILIAEGKTEALAYPTASEKLSNLDPETYSSLSALGIVVFDAETDSQIEPCGAVFKTLGKRVYAVFDKQNDVTTTQKIEQAVDLAFEAPTKGFEDLIVSETKETALRRFAKLLIEEGDWPSKFNGREPSESTSLDDLKKVIKEVLKKKKGEGFASKLLWLCSIDEMPETIKETILKLTQDVYPHTGTTAKKEEEE